MARIQLATGRIQFDEEDELYYFTTESGEAYTVPFESMQTGPGKLIYDDESDSHHIVTSSGNEFTFRDSGILQLKGVSGQELYSTVVGHKTTVPSDEEVLLPEGHGMVVDSPYTVNGSLQVDGRLTVL